MPTEGAARETKVSRKAGRYDIIKFLKLMAASPGPTRLPYIITPLRHGGPWHRVGFQQALSNIRLLLPRLAALIYTWLVPRHRYGVYCMANAI
jgi:hypothetical protein